MNRKLMMGIGAIGSMAGVVIASLSALRPLWWLLRWLTPATVIMIGVCLVFWGTTHKGTVPDVSVPAE